MLTLASQLLHVAKDFPEFSEDLDPLIANVIYTQSKREAQVKTAGTKLKDIMGGKSILGLKKSVAHRIERQLRMYGLDADSAAILLGSREIKIVITASITDPDEDPYTDFAANYIAQEIVMDLQRSLAYKVTGKGRYSTFTDSVVITLFQKV